MKDEACGALAGLKRPSIESWTRARIEMRGERRETSDERHRSVNMDQGKRGQRTHSRSREQGAGNMWTCNMETGKQGAWVRGERAMSRNQGSGN